jgi:lipopolysaccharide transport system ATP-binding protein
MAIAIKVEDLSKAYQIGQIGTGTISRDLERWLAKKRGKEDPFLRIGEVNDRTVIGESNIVWSLKDINFEIQQGDAVGIIGRNGAGKSTLLKLLSKITTPTTGIVKVKGRIASLLEVGTGFHPELTGRENIYLNGAILGMRKKEIDRKFDEIVAFSGIDRYIDTPVKRYSSGMHVRLAFAVAAHLDSEVLLIDEVLAVGDAEFQKKCLGKINDVTSNEGRTVVFVSHDLAAVVKLTKTSILLKNGTMYENGITRKVINTYLSTDYEKKTKYIGGVKDTAPSITRIEVITSNPNNVQVHGKKLSIEFDINFPVAIEGAILYFQVFNSKMQPIINPWFEESRLISTAGTVTLVCNIPKTRFYVDTYSITAHLGEIKGKQHFESVEHVCPFEVNMFETHRQSEWIKDACAYIEDFSWEVKNDNMNFDGKD